MKDAFFDENTSEFGSLLTQPDLPSMVYRIYRVKLLVLENFKTRICLNPEYSKTVFQRINDLKIY